MASGFRETLVLLLVFALLLGGVALYTRNWPPAVIVESGSMMHADDEVAYGRFGTIDPGDLVLVRSVGSIEAITTLVEGGRDRYGSPGDVIIYYPGNDRGRTPIIHRAVAYVELAPGPAYWVRWSDEAPCEGGATKDKRAGHSWCRYGSDGILVPSIPIEGDGAGRRYRPPASGFITKGDNPVTNAHIDALSLPGVTRPVPIEWVEGVSRGEVPWLGLIKLALAGQPNEDNPPPSWAKVGAAYAPADLWVMLGVSLFLLVGVPLGLDAFRAIQRRRQEKTQGR